jgi:DNA gyrase/topoisomerase IV subunit B
VYSGKGVDIAVQVTEKIGARLVIAGQNPENRTLLQVTVAEAHEADKTLDILMGEEVEPRKKFIQTHAKAAKNLDI